MRSSKCNHIEKSFEKVFLKIFMTEAFVSIIQSPQPYSIATHTHICKQIQFCFLSCKMFLLPSSSLLWTGPYKQYIRFLNTLRLLTFVACTILAVIALKTVLISATCSTSYLVPDSSSLLLYFFRILLLTSWCLRFFSFGFLLNYTSLFSSE